METGPPARPAEGTQQAEGGTRVPSPEACGTKPRAPGAGHGLRSALGPRHGARHLPWCCHVTRRSPARSGVPPPRDATPVRCHPSRAALRRPPGARCRSSEGAGTAASRGHPTGLGLGAAGRGGAAASLPATCHCRVGAGGTAASLSWHSREGTGSVPRRWCVCAPRAAACWGVCPSLPLSLRPCPCACGGASGS